MDTYFLGDRFDVNFLPSFRDPTTTGERSLSHQPCVPPFLWIVLLCSQSDGKTCRCLSSTYIQSADDFFMLNQNVAVDATKKLPDLPTGLSNLFFHSASNGRRNAIRGLDESSHARGLFSTLSSQLFPISPSVLTQTLCGSTKDPLMRHC